MFCYVLNYRSLNLLCLIPTMGNLYVKSKGKPPLPPKPSPSCVLSPDIRTTSNLKIVVSLHTYNARDQGDLSFQKGDRLGILDDSDTDWWCACHLTRMTEGLVPCNYVAPQKTLESEDWFFGRVSCKDAEKMLMVTSNPRGTFLIRNCEQTGAYSLSVLDWERKKGAHVKHYKIKTMDNGSFYVTPRKTFVTLQALVAYYSEGANDLCRKLKIPCNKPKPHMWDLSPDTRDEFEISRSSLQLIQKLGCGYFKAVWYGKWKGNTEVAITVFKSDTMAHSAFLEEATIMKKFRHEKLVSLYAVCSKEEPILMVTEYMVNGNLLEFLRTQEGRNLGLHALIDMAAQIASGMAYLEKEQFIHGNLAARNILVGDNNVVKVADFGLTRNIRESEHTPGRAPYCALKWTAPEAILLGMFSIKSDVWSYGIVLYELITHGQVPYPGMHNREVSEKARSNIASFLFHSLNVDTVTEQIDRGYRMPKPTNCECPDSVYNMMLQCWDADPEKRPTFEFLFRFFDGYFISPEPSYCNAEDF